MMPLPEPQPPAPAGLPLQAPAPADAELAARARRGDGLAFELIRRRHNRRLFRIARGLVWSDAEAEDVLQEGYVRACAASATTAALGRLPAGARRVLV